MFAIPLGNVCALYQIVQTFWRTFADFCNWRAAKGCKSGISRQELFELDPYSKDSLVAKIDFDTAQNEPRNVWITDLSDHMCRSHAERLVCVASPKTIEKARCDAQTDKTNKEPSVRHFGRQAILSDFQIFRFCSQNVRNAIGEQYWGFDHSEFGEVFEFRTIDYKRCKFEKKNKT